MCYLWVFGEVGRVLRARAPTTAECDSIVGRDRRFTAAKRARSPMATSSEVGACPHAPSRRAAGPRLALRDSIVVCSDQILVAVRKGLDWLGDATRLAQIEREQAPMREIPIVSPRRGLRLQPRGEAGARWV